MKAYNIKRLFLRNRWVAGLLLIVLEILGQCRTKDAPMWDGSITVFKDGSVLEIDYTLGDPIIRAYIV